jgi:DNA-binding CsgD family transcriptional regulator
VIIVGMLVDDKGKLWMATAAGLSEFDTENETFISFDANYGLQGGFYSLNTQTTLSSGEMFFGGSNGFNIFNPRDINRQTVFPKVVISDIKLNFKSVLLDHSKDTLAKINIFSSEINRIKTEKNTKTISIEFAALNYSITKEIVYSYYLEGYDENWIVTNSDNRRATYTNLDGGKYIFKVRASNEKGNWGNQVTSLQIIVQPPFWKTWWFRSSIILLLALYILYYFRNKLSDLKKEINFYKERNLSEKLLKEQELLMMKNEELSQQLQEKAKQLASMAVNKVDHSDWLNTVYKRLQEMKQNASALNLSKFNQILSLFEKKANLHEQDDYNENFDLIYENFTKRFAAAYPKITHKDLRICAYIRMNKSNKEIAALLSITQRSLEISRYRIRKKMNLDNSMNLNDFILRF